MATAPALTFPALLKAIEKGDLAPVYLLHGAEGQFIDELVKKFEEVVPPADRSFALHILYAPQVEPGAVMDLCYSVPMMCERQVVILKEAQAVPAATLNKLHRYCENPSPQTVLVISCRGEQARGKELMAAVRKNGVIFESKKINISNADKYVSTRLAEKGLSVEPKALAMIVDYIGADLSHLYNEIDKLAEILPKGARVTPEVVEQNVGVSREFNSYELIDALAEKNAARCYRIINYFRSNPKAVPMVMLTAALYTFFANLLTIYFMPDKSDRAVMEALKFKWPMQLRPYSAARQRYNAFQVIEVIWSLRRFDAQIKGALRQNEHDLLRELVFHILNAPGNLGV